jgi:hypothetical protein
MTLQVSKIHRGEESKRMSPVLKHKNLLTIICSFLGIVDLQKNAKLVSRAFRDTCNAPLVVYPLLQQELLSLLTAHLFITEKLKDDWFYPRCDFCQGPASPIRDGDLCCTCFNLAEIDKHLSNPCTPKRPTKVIMRSILWVTEQGAMSPFLKTGTVYEVVCQIQTGMKELLQMDFEDEFQ